jgi:hypothetical protein
MMSEASEQKVSSLLQQGLEFYGTGDVARAFLLWSEALELDPGNEEALDYMRDADRRAKPRGGNVEIGAPSIVEDARRLLRSEDGEAALELLMNAPGSGSLENEAMIELLRARLFQQYRAELGDLTQVPRVVALEKGDLQSRNLPSNVGFLLSMIDGMTPLCDLVSVSGMDRFEALRSLCRMHQAGIVTWETA